MVIITVWLMLSEDRDEPIKVIVETPPMTDVGAVGDLIDYIDEPKVWTPTPNKTTRPSSSSGGLPHRSPMRAWT